MPGLGASFGRGAMTTNLIDIQNADVIMATSNMAENHPVGFQWVVRAKERGAKFIHVDPRYTRTSALADIHVPLRSGTNIAFFGGLIAYAMNHDKIHTEYVANYTNAGMLIDEGFKFQDGMFAGYDEAGRKYDRTTWKYQTNPDGTPKRDRTLQHPRTVYQLMKQHYSRYTPEMVERVCGIPKEKFIQVAELFCSTGGPKKTRTGTITYALNLTQHTNGVQNIRALAILQLLLGNIGMPGGGVVALRGHANVQGATDLAVLYQDLPGYLAMPLRDVHPDLATYLEKQTPKGGYWTKTPDFMISLLKAWYGDAATRENDFGYDWIPKREKADAYSQQHIFVDMYAGKIKGFFAIGQNPAVGNPNAKMARAALARLDWLVVKDIFETETAAFWKAPGVDPKSINTEVFFLPAAPAAEKNGTLTNTMRLIQWHNMAVEPPDDVRSDLHFWHHLGKRIKALYASSAEKRDQGIKALVWDYPEEGKHQEPSAAHVLREMNGYTWAPTWDKRTQLKSFGECKADGSTACGCWIYTGVFPDEKTNRAASRQIDKSGKDYLQHGWGFSWPANRRIMYNRASADLDGKPWVAEKALVYWDPAADGGKGKWVGRDVPDYKPDMAPHSPPMKDGPFKGIGGDYPFIMRADGVGGLFSPLVDGPIPEHYEPVEAPVKNLLSKQQNNPVVKIWQIADNRNELAEVGSAKFPYVLTTYRLTEHHLSGVMSRNLPWLAEMFASHFAEISQELAAEKGIKHGDVVRVSTPRGSIKLRAMVTRRLKPFTIDGKPVHQIGIPWHWGFMGIATGEITNDLVASVGDPNVYIQESKALMCNVEKASGSEGVA